MVKKSKKIELFADDTVCDFSHVLSTLHSVGALLRLQKKYKLEDVDGEEITLSLHDGSGENDEFKVPAYKLLEFVRDHLLAEIDDADKNVSALVSKAYEVMRDE